ncbi:uncharacterized protein LY79DRAFT_590430 [Colletotrichum navitas]|uniref:Uncharacterized protein n=1 Tax=Colletotrichum navitas TaxID=681940 RepID=A0AAD8V355_9PEZI|nr:uncharacterized protein LY79DRAFT_590430 [Colletotrichum navitas]KAK1590475.1 hypothetical protein LY79DRAFT_590430 [Colletotrichum navitas]
MAPTSKPKRRHSRSARKRPSKKNKVDKTQPLRFSLLPPEMRVTVVENMFAVGGRRLLRDFSVTSRDSRALAQKELYREISIQYEVELCHLTRSLIENPPLRKLIHTVRLNANYWCFRRHDARRIFREWPNAPIDESRLSQSDRQLLILLRSFCNERPSDNIQCVFGLFLFFVDQTKHLALDIGYDWGLLDNFLAAGFASTSSTNPNLGTALLPVVKILGLSTKQYLQKAVRTIQAGPYHPFKALTASIHLREFTFTGDMDRWSNLDAIDPGMKLPFTTVNLVASSCTASTLSKFLRHCPDLQCLNVTSQGYNSEVDTNECLNTILTKFCPQVRELSLRNGGRSRDFFRSSATHTITCLPEMTNLKELRMEVDAFFVRGSDISAFRLPNKLPDQLEKLFLDCSFALTHFPFNMHYTRMTARSPEAIAYRQAVDNMIQAICKAREDRFPRLNTIVIGAKWVAPVQWTRIANKALSKTGARIKVTSSKDIQRLWTCSWDAMKV